MAPADDLGNLILNLNPYTNRTITDITPNRTIGQMDIYCGSPASGTNPPDVSQIEVEADGPYRQEWTFKGEPQKVGMAYRIKYRFAVSYVDSAGTTHRSWLEDYLLIGFEGSMGG
jgi:hypothetical protein